MIEHRAKSAVKMPRSLRRYAKSGRGSVLAWVAFLTVPLLGFIGLGVDVAHGYLVRARLSQAVDSAALAAGRETGDTVKAEQLAQMVFTANFPSGYMDAAPAAPTITFDTTAGTVTASASTALPTYFVRLLGFDTFTVSASTEVTRKSVAMDVVVSIDVSGSMNEYVGAVKKIDAASDSARTLVDILFGAADQKDLLKMGLVTWSANARILDINTSYNAAQTTANTVSAFVNPYTGLSQSKLYFAGNSPVPLLSAPPNGWTGCTRARFFNDGADNDGDLSVASPTIGGKQWMGWDPAVQTITGYTGKKKTPVYADMQCPNQGIQRLTNTRQQMVSALQQVKNPSGNTNLIMGLMWAWTLLGVPGSGSPFEGDGTALPTPGQPEVIRAIVLMTDGDNTQSATDAYEGALAPSDLDARTLAAAQKAKAAGIIIYTIRFGTGSNSEGLLKQVASGPTAPYYQYAPTAGALDAAFREIGRNLSKLRISK